MLPRPAINVAAFLPVSETPQPQPPAPPRTGHLPLPDAGRDPLRSSLGPSRQRPAGGNLLCSWSHHLYFWFNRFCWRPSFSSLPSWNAVEGWVFACVCHFLGAPFLDLPGETNSLSHSPSSNCCFKCNSTDCGYTWFFHCAITSLRRVREKCQRPWGH